MHPPRAPARQRSLAELCVNYPTDKCPQRHAYVELYDRLFQDERETMDRLLEIGILYGVSHLKPGGTDIIEDVRTSLPQFYPDPEFNVAPDGSNTTLGMLERYVRTREIYSDYMTGAEMRYLEANIESVMIHFHDTGQRSIVAVLRKKDKLRQAPAGN